MPTPLDQATIIAHNYDEIQTLSLWYQVEECEKCSLVMKTTLGPALNESLLVDTKYRVTLQIQDYLSGRSLCTIPFRWFTDQGEYFMGIKRNRTAADEWTCWLSNSKPGRNNILPLLMIILLYFLVAGFYYLKKRFSARTDISQVRTDRLKSLDAFRGLTIILMIFVNYGGGGYSIFEHKPWFGLSLADCIFPWFIFIMGVSLSLSIESQVKKRKETTFSIWCHIISRSLKLFLLGICLNSDHSDLSTLRIPGVLQRFGVSYFFVASCRLLTCKIFHHYHAATEDDNPPDWKSKHKKLLIYLPETILYSSCIIIYFWATLFWRYSETCPVGYQGPGGLHFNGSFFNCTGGAANVIDRLVLGENHLYQRATSQAIYYNTMPHDPEGLLGTTMSILLTGIGAIAGHQLVRVEVPRLRIFWWLMLAFLLGILSLILARSSIIFMSKNLWSFTFIASTGAIGLVLLTYLYWLIDVWGLWKHGEPFIYPGMNPILLYLGHSVGARYFPFYFAVDETSHFQRLIRDLIGVNLWLLISFILARKKIFISV